MIHVGHEGQFGCAGAVVHRDNPVAERIRVAGQPLLLAYGFHFRHHGLLMVGGRGGVHQALSKREEEAGGGHSISSHLISSQKQFGGSVGKAESPTGETKPLVIAGCPPALNQILHLGFPF